MSHEEDQVFWGYFDRVRKIDSPRVHSMGLYSGFYAQFYDLATSADSNDLPEILAIAARHPGPILDVGCGTGRLLVRLAEHGHEVFGIDNSADMLQLLERHLERLPPAARGRAGCMQGDATAFSLQRTFSVVLVSSFHFLVTKLERLAFLRCAREHLSETGVLVIDYIQFDEETIAQADGMLQCADSSGSDNPGITIFGMKFSEDHQRWWWNFHTEIFNPDGSCDNFIGSATFACLDDASLLSTLDEAGFHVLEHRRTTVPLPGIAAQRNVIVAGLKQAVRYPLWHPYLPMNGGEAAVTVFTEANGSTVTDRAGKQYIDASGGLWSAQVGFGHPEVIDAISEQLRRLSHGTLFALRGNDTAAELARKLVEVTNGPLTRVFLTCSGSESVELAIKMSRLYFELDGQPDKKAILYFDESYHGTFYGSMGISALIKDRERYAPHLPGLIPVHTPNPRRCPEGVSLADFSAACAAEVERRIVQSKLRVAAFIMEPILGSAGVVVPPRSYFDEVQRICRKHEVLLILDEVATGFGRTGRWFASEHFALTPDLLLLSKGMNGGYLPLGAVLFTEKLAHRLLEHGSGIGHGSSGNGNPACCASALAVIRLIERDELVSRSAQMGEYFLERLRELLVYPMVADARGVGLMLAIELGPVGGGLDSIFPAIVRAGVLPYPFASGLSFFPPLNITKADVDSIVDRFHAVFRATSSAAVD